MTLRRYRVVDADNRGIDKLVVQIDPVLDFNAEVVVPVDVSGTPLGTLTNPLQAQDAGNWTQLLDYDADGNVIYHGKAIPGTASSAAAWQIKKFAYTAGNLTAITFANGSADYSAVWDDRASLSYS